MRKKLLSFVLAVFMVIPCCFALTACKNDKHTCKFEATWTKNETHHWHKCEDKNCNEISDKAEHSWNAGEITTPATSSAQGVKTYTCTVCGQTKTEAVDYFPTKTMTEEQWTKALTFEGINNFSFTSNYMDTMLGIYEQDGVKIRIIEKMKSGDEWVDDSEECYDNASGIYYLYTKEEGNWERSEISSESYQSILAGSCDMFGLFSEKFENFVYDETTGKYNFAGPYTVNNPGASFTFENVSFSFIDGRLISYSWTLQSMNQTGDFLYDSCTITIPTDYTVVQNQLCM